MDVLPDEEPLAEDTIAWRICAFRHMGFDLGSSMILAGTRDAGVHEIERALENGCTLELAIEIFS